MPDPGSPWERKNPADGFGYLPFPIRTPEDQAKWDACSAANRVIVSAPTDANSWVREWFEHDPDPTRARLRYNGHGWARVLRCISDGSETVTNRYPTAKQAWSIFEPPENPDE